LARLVQLWRALPLKPQAATRTRFKPANAKPKATAKHVFTTCTKQGAMVAFIPPAYYAGVSTTRHMVGTNLATSLAFVVAARLAVSMIWQLLTRPARRAVGAAGPAAEQVATISPGSRR
jgi:hypothetical protein